MNSPKQTGSLCSEDKKPNNILDANDMISIFKESGSKFECVVPELGFGMPCVICRFRVKKQTESPCCDCSHSLPF